MCVLCFKINGNQIFWIDYIKLVDIKNSFSKYYFCPPLGELCRGAMVASPASPVPPAPPAPTGLLET